MTRRSKSALLAALAMLAIPAMTACVIQPGGDTDTEPTDTETVETEPTETGPVETEPAETDPAETDPAETGPETAPAGAGTPFDGPDGFYAAMESELHACVETQEQPLPEGLDQIEPKLAGGTYAFCTLGDDRQLVAILLADSNEVMADTQLATDRDIADFKREAGVTSVAIGGNWLITSPEDSLVEVVAATFGGEVY